MASRELFVHTPEKKIDIELTPAGGGSLHCRRSPGRPNPNLYRRQARPHPLHANDVHNRYMRHGYPNSLRQHRHVPRWPRSSRLRSRVSLHPKIHSKHTNPSSGLVATVPIYLSEISDPRYRGLIGGISGCGISFGTMMSNWVGYACSYAPYGPMQWRLPLGIQIPWGIIMFIGLGTFMPHSPRQLIRSGKLELARSEFARIRRGLVLHEMEEEFGLMKAQIEYEMERELSSYREIFRVFRHRVLV